MGHVQGGNAPNANAYSNAYSPGHPGSHHHHTTSKSPGSQSPQGPPSAPDRLQRLGWRLQLGTHRDMLQWASTCENRLQTIRASQWTALGPGGGRGGDSASRLAMLRLREGNIRIAEAHDREETAKAAAIVQAVRTQRGWSGGGWSGPKGRAGSGGSGGRRPASGSGSISSRVTQGFMSMMGSVPGMGGSGSGGDGNGGRAEDSVGGVGPEDENPMERVFELVREVEVKGSDRMADTVFVGRMGQLPSGGGGGAGGAGGEGGGDPAQDQARAGLVFQHMYVGEKEDRGAGREYTTHTLCALQFTQAGVQRRMI